MTNFDLPLQQADRKPRSFIPKPDYDQYEENDDISELTEEEASYENLAPNEK